MKLTTLLMAGAFALGLAACQQAAETTNESAAEQNARAGHDHAEGPSLAQKAANGKWLINAEMKQPLANSEQLLTAYLANAGTDFVALAEKLQTENQTLIKSCTMEGASHDALHAWLYPHMDVLKALSATDNQVVADSLIAQLKTSFETFHRDFQ